jgi:hypothetical protein
VYSLPADFARRVEDAREVGREPEADRLQIARHALQREAFREAWAKGEVVAGTTSRRDRTRIRPEERHPSGTVGELERVPDPAPALVAALAAYLEKNPRDVDEGPVWLADTLWAFSLVEGHPTRGDVESALVEIEWKGKAG